MNHNLPPIDTDKSLLSDLDLDRLKVYCDYILELNNGLVLGIEEYKRYYLIDQLKHLLEKLTGHINLYSSETLPCQGYDYGELKIHKERIEGFLNSFPGGAVVFTESTPDIATY